jgi:hypothetical protein
MLEAIKTELRYRGFSLRYLGHDGRWKDLTPWKFHALREEDYRRLITGAKWLRPRSREELVEQLSELYNIVKQTPKVEERSLEFWSKKTSEDRRN